MEKLEQRELYSKADLLEQGEGIGAYVQFAPGDKRDCVAIFNPIDPEADKITILVHGLVDDIVGWDFVDGDSIPEDLNGHGAGARAQLRAPR